MRWSRHFWPTVPRSPTKMQRPVGYWPLGFSILAIIVHRVLAHIAQIALDKQASRQILKFAEGFYGKIIATAFLQPLSTFTGTAMTMAFAIMVHLLLYGGRVLVFTQLKQVYAAIGVCLILQFGLSRLRMIKAQKTGILIKDNVRSNLLQKLFIMGPAYMTENRTGDVASSVTDRVEWLRRYFTDYLPAALGAIVNCAILLALMFPMDWATATVCLLAAIGMIEIPMAFYPIMRERGKKEWAEHSRYYSDCLDGIQGVSTLKAFNANDEQMTKMRVRGEDFRNAAMRHLKVTILEGGVLEFFARIGSALSIAVAAVRFHNGYIDSRTIIYLFHMAAACFTPMLSLISAWHIGFNGIAASYRIGEILDAPVGFHLCSDLRGGLLRHEALEKEIALGRQGKLWAGKTEEDFGGGIAFEGVSFAYQAKEGNVLHDVSFTVPPGAMTALVGPSGGGKSTIARILAGFYIPAQGSVIVGDDVLSEDTVERIQNRIAAVWQYPHLLYGTVYENILVGKPAASEIEVYHAAKKANIHDFIMTLPEGYRTMIGERGMRFSGGERQRIVIARAYLRDAPVLIFDEATSSLDRKNELEIQRSFRDLRRGKTALVIAHRLATIEDADQICIIEGGKVVETGTHQELMGSSERYMRLMGDQLRRKEAL